ncbi:sulfurtransferase [Achromobacter sp. UBA2119]|uniref:sulfurtransferase n=1 Tax=Achromobacter sp. UBA2119 TaxID=1945911 RepID=UPI00258118F6|nr:sulfurtransferase [Achromobacter sp. UBA2119]
MTTTLISAADLASRLDTPDVRVFDVRHDLTNHAAGRQAYDAGHIPGARYLDHETELAAAKTGKNGRHPLPDRAQFGALMAAHGVTPSTLVVAYDASGGMYAAHLWWMLRWLGHDQVAVLDGGWQAWTAAGLPVSHDAAPAVQPGKPVEPGAPLAGTVDAQTVLANIAQPAFTVIDARAANRYRGEVEPMDPVAGHIPGALNRPNGENLQPDGRFKSADALRAEFGALLAGRDPASIVHQCGSGITACHNLLSMEIAGLSGSRLYPGSWSEWCSDPARPVAKGE